MKYFFTITPLVLILASLLTFFTEPQRESNVPVIYWCTDVNPARAAQIAEFEKWLVANGYTTKAGGPICQVELDTANRASAKQLIQGVSGVADTLQDVMPHGFQEFQAVGMLADVTSAAKRLGFEITKTYPSIRSQLVAGGKQYMFPANVTGDMLWVNKGTFKRFHQPLPPQEWSFKTFEKMGLAYVKAANKGLPYRQYFYADDLSQARLYRSLGLSFYNETMTACALNDPRYVHVLKLLYKWTYKDHILPSAGDVSSFVSAAGYEGASPQLFYNGHYAMMYGGRYDLLQFRQFENPMQLTIVQPPNGGFPNTIARARGVAIYAGASPEQKKLGELFLAYLVSKRYSMTFLKYPDGLPPVPKYTKTPEFLHPPQWPNEWGVHEIFAKSQMTLGIVPPNCPFVLTTTANRMETDEYQYFMNHRATAAQAAAEVAAQVNERIQKRLKEDPSLLPEYKKRIAIQKKIDAYRQAGKKVPLKWLYNPFYKVYYQKMGWAQPTK